MFVGERMHACIAALSQCVPSLVVDYSVKARGIMNDILGENNERLGLTIPVVEFVDTADRSKRLAAIWEKRTEIRRLLDELVPKIKDRAALNFDLLGL